MELAATERWMRSHEGELKMLPVLPEEFNRLVVELNEKRKAFTEGKNNGATKLLRVRRRDDMLFTSTGRTVVPCDMFYRLLREERETVDNTRLCAQCRVAPDFTGLPGTFSMQTGSFQRKEHAKCGRCKEVRYCSKECQRLHWPVHKLQCK